MTRFLLLFAFATVSLVGCGSMAEYEHVETPRAAPAGPSVGVTSSDEIVAERAARAEPQSAVADRFADTDPSALSDFKPALDPYGTWVDDATYGTVWVPASTAVGADFAPYVTNGHWAVDGNNDWLWVSDYDSTFGWATFHYGRWVWVDSRGWSWIPGRQYAPAWVVWRTGDPGYEYVGWAPAPPYYYWSGGAVVWLGYYPPAAFVFCHTNYVFRDHVNTYLVDRGHVAAVASSTHTFATPSGAGAHAGGGHVLATPQHGPTAASGHIPAGSWPTPASRVASAPNGRFASPAAMGRTHSFSGPGARTAGTGFGSPPRGSNGFTPGHALAPRSLGASTTPSASRGYAPGHSGSSYAPSPYGGARGYGSGPTYGGGHYGGGSYGGGSYGGGYHPSYGAAPAPTTTTSPSYHSSDSAPSVHHSSFGRSGGGFHGGGGGGGHRRLGRHFMKPSALSPVVALVTALLAASCLPDDRAHAVQQAAPPPVQPSQAANVTILTGGTLTTDPGKGAGVFVEYLGQGQWSVWTSCDSAVQGGQCQYDLYLTPESGGSVVAAALDPQTGTLSSAAGGADAHWVTSYARNAVNLTVSPPGSGLLVDARLDGVSDPHVFYWQGPDVVHTGAPTDPVLFLPTVP